VNLLFDTAAKQILRARDNCPQADDFWSPLYVALHKDTIIIDNNLRNFYILAGCCSAA